VKKKNHFVLGIIPILLLIAIPLRANSTGLVTDIQIEGNRITKEYIIRREIHHPVGVPFDSLIAKEDRNRIDNLEIFSDVQYFLVTNEEGSSTLIYSVVEAWRIFPVPILYYEEETGWSYGAAVMIKNFRGRNEIFQAAVTGGGRILGSFQFQDPWIIGDHISLQAHAFLSTYDHPYLGFEYEELDVELTLGRYFGYRWKLWITGSIEERRVDYFYHGREDTEQLYFQSKLKVLYDTRDLYLDPSEGILIYNDIQPDIGLDKTSPHNLFWDCQVSLYRTVIPGRKKWVAGGSFFFHRYFGKSIPYRIKMVGGAKSVRGWAVLDSIQYEKKPFRSGLNSYYASFELRQTVIPRHIIAPRTEFGIILAEFIDFGIADYDFLEMFRMQPIAGAGIGMRIFIPGAQLFRIDYGFGFHAGKWESGIWHFMLGHKF